MNMPAPTADRATGTNAAVPTTAGLGTTARDPSAKAGVAFGKILSGLTDTVANPLAKPTGVAKPVVTTPAVPPGPASAPAADRAPCDPSPLDPATPATVLVDAMQGPAPSLATAATDVPVGHVPPPAEPVPPGATATVAGKAKHAAIKPADTEPTSAPVSTPADLATPPIANPTTIPAPAAPVALGAAGREREPPDGTKVRLDPAAAAHEGEGALSDRSTAAAGSLMPAAAASDAAVFAPTSAPVAASATAPAMEMAAASAVSSAGAAAAPAAAATPPPASAGRPPAGPAAQLETALVQVGQTAGLHHLTVRLDPLELGSVAIRIDRGNDGAATVQVTVERPETLRILLSDQQQLHRALDAAGLPQDGRTVTVSLATHHSSGAGGASGGLGDGGSGTANPGNGGFGGHQNDRPGQRPSRAVPLANTSHSSSGWQRAGVDITA